jgi:predicted aspartyl protease
VNRRLWSVLVLSLCGQAANGAEWNPYAKPADEFERKLQAAAFGAPGADRQLQDWLAANPALAIEDLTRGYQQLCRDYGFLTWNKLRSSVCVEYSRLKKAKGGDDDEAMAIAFADQPPTRAIGSAKVPLIWNAFGSQSATVTVNGVTSNWFVDTGAEITVVTESLAALMAIRQVSNVVRVGTTTADVTGKVGIIDRLQIGSAYVENVPVLILPDAQLKLGNVHQIDGILGLQVFVAFGRMAWADGGRMLALGEAAPPARSTAPRIYWHDEGVGVPVRTNRGVVGGFLDTGANATSWRAGGLSLLDPKLLAQAKEKTARVGGAGGVVERKQRELPPVRFELGPLPVQLSKVSIAPPGHEGAAWIGMDAVSQFGIFILDFEQMRIDGRLKTAAERKASRQPTMTSEDVKPDDNKTKPHVE